MNIVNIHHHHSHVNHNTYYSPELVHLLRQFFASAEQRNEKLKTLLRQLQSEATPQNGSQMAEQLVTHTEETEIDIELVKKLLS